MGSSATIEFLLSSNVWTNRAFVHPCNAVEIFIWALSFYFCATIIMVILSQNPNCANSGQMTELSRIIHAAFIWMLFDGKVQISSASKKRKRQAQKKTKTKLDGERAKSAKIVKIKSASRKSSL
jgi:hypothetical protein